jgi:hypothetical protein
MPHTGHRSRRQQEIMEQFIERKRTSDVENETDYPMDFRMPPRGETAPCDLRKGERKIRQMAQIDAKGQARETREAVTGEKGYIVENERVFQKRDIKHARERYQNADTGKVREAPRGGSNHSGQKKGTPKGTFFWYRLTVPISRGRNLADTLG